MRRLSSGGKDPPPKVKEVGGGVRGSTEGPFNVLFLAYNNIYLTRKRVEKNNRAIMGVVVLQGALNLLFAAILLSVRGVTRIGAAFPISQGGLPPLPAQLGRLSVLQAPKSY